MCTRLGIERRFERRHLGTKPAQHVFENVIVANTECIADNLNIGMSVSKMPCEPDEFARQACVNFKKRFWFADDTHDSAVVQDKSIAIL